MAATTHAARALTMPQLRRSSSHAPVSLAITTDRTQTAAATGISPWLT